MEKKLKIFIFVIIGALFISVAVKASTIIGNNITTAGKIGIGTTNPQGNLTIEDATQSNLILRSGSLSAIQVEGVDTADMSLISGNNNAFIQFVARDWDASSSQWGLGYSGDWKVGTVEDNHGDANFTIWDNLADGPSIGSRLFIDGQSGYVGIGTTTPEAELHVDGTSFFNGMGVFRNDVQINNTDTDMESELTVDGTYNASSAAGIRIYGTTSRLSFIGGANEYPQAWSMGLNTELSGTPNIDFKITNVSSGTNPFVIKQNSSYVGIGTTTPENRLDVWGNFRVSTSSIPLLFADTASKFVTVNTTDNNDSIFRVLANSNNRNAIEGYSDAAESGWAGVNGTSLNGPGVSGNSYGGFTAGIAGTGFIGVDGGGRGDSSIGVNGTNAGAGNYGGYFKSVGGFGLVVETGNVGIGTTTPEAFFQVYNGGYATTSPGTTTVEIGGVDGSQKGSCLKLRDNDGAGWTYCTTLDGSLTCSLTSCE